MTEIFYEYTIARFENVLEIDNSCVQLKISSVKKVKTKELLLQLL